jgi:hypothetical protein
MKTLNLDQDLDPHPHADPHLPKMLHSDPH